MTKTDQHLQNALEGFARINVSDELRQTALSNLERWLTDDAFEFARPQLESLLEAENYEALFDAFFQEIPFGTGGRRGPVGYGPNRINPFTISTSIQGHCEFLKKHRGSDLSVVIAYDVREFHDLRGNYDAESSNPLLKMGSRDFARIAAQVYAANGVRVWFPDPDSESLVSTPELSFGIRRLNADGGLNISASHNHPDDNGAKIYNAYGAQEIPPLDEEMAKIVEGVDQATTMSWDEAVKQGLIRWIPADVHEHYVVTNRDVSLRPDARSAKVIFTPLHGTGWYSVGAALSQAGFEVTCYPDQGTPDGTFPNVPFRSPNPEVPQSLEGATEYAQSHGADLVLAADPDADRLGMVVPDSTGEWVFLNGNQIGSVLASYLLSERAARGGDRTGFAVTTVVTTSLFRRIAESFGVETVDDLGIGFKYISSILNQLDDGKSYPGVSGTCDDFVLGIEESHGYLVTPTVRDKDAAGAGVLLAEITSILKNEGRSVLDYLDDVYRRFGYVSNHLVSTVMLGASGFVNIRAIQDSLRGAPLDRVGDLQVERFTDRWDESGPLGPIASSTDRASRDLLTFELEQNVRITLRPSGTESKNKVYVEACGEPLGDDGSAADLEREKARVDALAVRVAQDFTLAMLGRIDVSIPRYALDVSDLVALDWKQDFADRFLPELTGRLQGGEKATDLGDWVDERLRPYGADGRLLVKDAVASYCREAQPPREVRGELETLFGLRS